MTTQKISLVVAMANNRVIGVRNGLPWHLPADLQHFKRVTMGKPIVMGRKTYDSIGRPLPGRRNLVISRTPELVIPGCEVYTSLQAALAALTQVPEVMVIGGGELFKQALPLAHHLYLTFVEADIEGDVFFPVWNAHEWREISREVHASDPDNTYPYTFVELVRADTEKRC